MKYLVAYELSDESGEHQHVRYYDALDESTAIEMFSATCEESLVGEEPQILEVKKIADEDSCWHSL